MSEVIVMELTAGTSALSSWKWPCLPQCPWKKLHPDKNPSCCLSDASSFTFPFFLNSLLCPYRCFSTIPPSSSLKRFSPSEALPLHSTAALSALTPVILAPDSRSFVDKEALRSLAAAVLSVDPVVRLLTQFSYFLH